MSPFETAKETVLYILEDDHTELWFLVADIHKLYPNASLPELQAVTKQVVYELMCEHPIQLLDPATELPLPDSAESVSKQIESLFTRLNQLPNIGDGIWLGIPRSSS